MVTARSARENQLPAQAKRKGGIPLTPAIFSAARGSAEVGNSRLGLGVWEGAKPRVEGHWEFATRFFWGFHWLQLRELTLGGQT